MNELIGESVRGVDSESRFQPTKCADLLHALPEGRSHHGLSAMIEVLSMNGLIGFVEVREATSAGLSPRGEGTGSHNFIVRIWTFPRLDREKRSRIVVSSGLAQPSKTNELAHLRDRALSAERAALSYPESFIHQVTTPNRFGTRHEDKDAPRVSQNTIPHVAI